MTEPEAPDGYVRFVERHLAALRTESERLTGERGQGTEIYPDALADVAARWRWLERRRPAVADAFLRRTLVARARRWRDEQLYPVEVSAAAPRPGWAAEVEAVPVPAEPWDASPRDPDRRWRRRYEGGPDEGRTVDVSAAAPPPLVPLDPTGPPPAGPAGPDRRPDAGGGRRGDPADGPAARWRTGGRVSLGLRQAAFLSPEHRAPAPVAEAAIAWWHAYEAQRRRRRVALAVGLFLAFTALANVATIY